MILLHNTFTCAFPAPLLLPSKKEKKKHSIVLLLNYMTSSRPGTKRREKHAYWRGALHKAPLLCIFMQMTLDYSRKSQSLLLLLPFGQSFCLAMCTESGSGQSPWLVLYKNYLKREIEVSLFICDTPQSWKWENDEFCKVWPTWSIFLCQC